MYFSRYTILDNRSLASVLKTSLEHGLMDAQISVRRQQYGKNEITASRVRWWHILGRQFASAFVYLLLGAAALALFLGEKLDAGMIMLFVTVNATLGFYQEFRSEQTAALLKKYLLQKIHVRRNGEIHNIDSTELLPGDIVLLQAGDVIPADMRLADACGLTVDESALTGESAPVAKVSSAQKKPADKIIHADNICFTGTHIVSGRAEGVVIGIGEKTVFGGVARLATETRHVSTFERGIGKFSSFILKLIFGTLTLVFLTHAFTTHSATSIGAIAIFSIALAVSVIPEALPVVMTFSLSHGARRLAKHGVVVKRLSAIEDLGSIQVLCSDKTGTLTENMLTVAKVFGANEKNVLFTAALGAVHHAEHRKQPSSDAFDQAILTALGTVRKKKLKEYRHLADIPFDPERRVNSVLIHHEDDGNVLIVRGAVETILAHTARLPETKKKLIKKWMAEEGMAGRRVIAIATKPIQKKIQTYTAHDETKGLVFAGCISFADPVKATSKRAVKDAFAMGVDIKILTGDAPEVAGAVAVEVGLIKSTGEVLTGDDFEALSPDKQHQAVETYRVFARVSPEQKYQIIKLLEEKYEVGFLGDGINDAPALKIANISMVVQGAAHIAQEASDIILLGKSLHVIVDGIREGRETFANSIKYIRATLTSNFGNFYSLAFVSLFIDYLPMLPLQLLMVNLLTDFPLMAIAVDHVDASELRSPRGYDIRNIIILATILGLVSSSFDFTFFALFHGFGEMPLQTNWFILSILTELALFFSLRTHFAFFKGKRPALILTGLALLSILAAMLIPFSSLGRDVFHFQAPTGQQIGMVLGLVFVYFIISEVVKLLYYRLTNHVPKPVQKNAVA